MKNFGEFFFMIELKIIYFFIFLYLGVRIELFLEKIMCNFVLIFGNIVVLLCCLDILFYVYMVVNVIMYFYLMDVIIINLDILFFFGLIFSSSVFINYDIELIDNIDIKIV